MNKGIASVPVKLAIISPTTMNTSEGKMPPTLPDSAANITAKADITFTGGGAGDVNGVAFTDGASFLAALNTALAPGSASFTDGRLTLDGAGAGVVVTSAPSPATAPGFSQSFGLNDLLVAFGQNLCHPTSPHCTTCPVAVACARVGVRRSR